MAPRTALALLALIAALGIGSTACSGGGQPIDTGAPGDDDDDDAFDATFQSGAFLALPEENCGSDGCHSAASQGGAGNLQLPDAAGTMTATLAYTELDTELVLNTGSPAASSLLTKGLGTGHGGSVQWATSDDTYVSVLAWITSGAQFN